MNRLDEIKKRLKEYREHENDAYDYDPKEASVIREFQNSAADNITFLLNLLNKK